MMFWECDLPPPVPVTVRVYVPRLVLFSVLMVSVEERVAPDARLAGFGLNAAVVSADSPCTVRLALPAKPLSETKFTV